MAADVHEALVEAAAEKQGGARELPPRLADVLDQIAALFDSFVALPAPGLSILLAVWVAGANVYSVFDFFGYLVFRSATVRCGKTQTLRLLAALLRVPITTFPTAPVLFRRARGVLLLDEVDLLRNADRERFGNVMAMLNGGFQQGAVVERCERQGKEFVVRQFEVFGPKALAGIEALADALVDRSFTIVMVRAPQRMPRFRVRRVEPELEKLRNCLERWAGMWEDLVARAYQALPDEVPALAAWDDRLQDIAEPLVVLAALADAERPEGPAILPRLLDGLGAAAAKREPSERERALRAFLALARRRLRSADEVFVPTHELLAACREDEDLAGLASARALARFLRYFDLMPRSTGRARGYVLTQEWLNAWWTRYGNRE